MKKGVLLLLPALSALCVALALPAHDYGFLAWVALVPLLVALKRSTALAGAALGFVYGYVFGLGSFWWLPGTAEVGFPQFFLVILPAFALFYVPFGLFYSLVNRALESWMIVLAPALWVGMEYLRAHLFFLSMPWNFIAHSQHHSLAIIQIADITGVYGIGFLIVMVNQFFASGLLLTRERGGAMVKRWAMGGVLTAALLGVTLFYGRYGSGDFLSTGTIRAAVVQANRLTRDNMPPAEQVDHLRAYRQLTLEAAEQKPDLILWPASSLPAQFSSRLVRRMVRQTAREAGTSLLVGGAGVEKFKPRRKGQAPYSNSEFLVGPDGRLKRKYDKIRLVPFNEYLPLQGIVPWPKWITTLKLSFIPGEKYTLFQVSDARFGTPICWESLFSDLFRRFVKQGANLMVNVTNEGYTGRSASPYQTLAMTVFRAVENRVCVIRAATTGISCVIGPNGAIIEKIRDRKGNDLFVAGTLVRDIPLYATRTFYTRHGDVFAFGCVGVALLGIVIGLFRRRKPRS